jgi:mannose-6-phosphate isomerase-like protein (cupin superfamily)
MHVQVNLAGDKKAVEASVSAYLDKSGFKIADRDFDRPWGGFFVLDESQAARFAQYYFPDVELSSLKITGKLSPKILIVAADMRLSWQYHHRRAEIWKLVAGTAGVVTSDDDREGAVHTLQLGEIIRLRQGQRHRLVGLNDWGMIAEIWQHTDANHPSDEDDIVRVQDDFGR